MNRSDVEASRAEAVRFIERCDALLSSQPSEYRVESKCWKPGPWTGNSPNADAAAVKRSSLDLTRALAHMRRR